MLFFSRPSDAQVERFLAQAAESEPSYSEIGATSGSKIPSSYVMDHNRVLLGKGESLFHQAALAVRDWKMFDLRWVRIYPSAPPIRTGENVAVIARWCNVYFVNACRIVDTIHEHVPIRKALRLCLRNARRPRRSRAEERFTVEWDRHKDEVWYDILGFSRPNQLLAKIGYPFARRLQKKFAADSKAAMVRAVSGRSL